MKVTNLNTYFVFGWNYQILQNGFQGKYHIKQVILIINEFLNFIDEYELEVTSLVVGNTLQKMKKDVEKKFKEDLDAYLPEDEGAKFKEYIQKITPTLNAELYREQAYILSEKRLGLKKLLNSIQDLFGSGVYFQLDYYPKYDFTEAGKCIAFERPTAAAFHILRGTEGVLKQFYQKKIKKKDQVENPMWAQMIDQLRQRKNTPKLLLDAYDNIRNNFRNPTLHPTNTYNLEEVKDLFSVCIDAVNKIIKYY